MKRTTLTFDELNSLSRDVYEEYFDVMGIPQDAKTDRILMAMALEDRFLDIFAWIEMQKRQGKPFFVDSMSMFEKAFLFVALTRLAESPDLTAMAQDFAGDVALSTFNHQDEDYFLSVDRAINMSATESNALNNYGELLDAKNAGMTKKRWHTIIDGREREWHEEVNGTVLPLDEPFEVNGELMMQPLDSSFGAGADNIANCRCWLTFE